MSVAVIIHTWLDSMCQRREGRKIFKYESRLSPFPDDKKKKTTQKLKKYFCSSYKPYILHIWFLLINSMLFCTLREDMVCLKEDGHQLKFEHMDIGKP